MKEATGELNMTVITVLIIAAVGGLATLVIVPMVGGSMRNSTCKSMFDENAKAVKNSDIWYCCPTGSYSASDCQEMSEE